MAIFGSLETVREQTATQPALQKALEYGAQLMRPDAPERSRLLALPSGGSVRVDLGQGMFAIDAAYLSKSRPEVFFETHRKYIDVQIIIEGAELMEVENVHRLVVSQPYHEERDFTKYADSATASQLVLRAGDAAVFFPSDGHMPSLQFDSRPVLVRKSVVKVPVG